MIRASGCALGASLLLLLIAAPGMGQSPARPGKPRPGANWTPPRTPDDQPNLEGVWEMSTLTPLERPAEFAGKAFLTEQEAAAYQKRTLEQLNSDRRDGGSEADLRRNYNEYWRDRGAELKPNLRTSLIVDPPDGRIPPFTPEGRKRRDAQMAASRDPSGPEDLALRIRCISRGLPMVPTPNNNFFQIVQSRGIVAILQEMMYEVRLIPLGTRPHAAPAVRGYMGDSRAHWEGNTLAIDTTNFIGKDDFLGADENLHLVERLTRTGPDTILYQFTVDDPTAFTRPWSGEIPMTRTTEGIFPYECHEGNYSMTDILSGARAQERQAAHR
ncbi:MAG TPA: hypothetical protein VJ732_18430 [Bryobacteraceae bacterium]|nr:hypothetical protein [Bryobacteraceae bacterium]